MDTIKSFKGYGKVDLAEDQDFRRKTRRRITIIAVSSVLLLLIVVGAAVGAVLSHKGARNDRGTAPEPGSSISQSIKTACDITRYPDVCFSSLSAAAANGTGGAGSITPGDIIRLSLRVASDGIGSIQDLPTQLLASVPNDTDPRLRAALQICSDLLAGSLDHLNDSMALLEGGAKGSTSSSSASLPSRADIDNLRTWLSATLADQDTCLDAFENATGSEEFRSRLQAALGNTTIFSSNSLALATGFQNLFNKLGLAGGSAASPTAPSFSGIPGGTASPPAPSFSGAPGGIASPPAPSSFPGAPGGIASPPTPSFSGGPAGIASPPARSSAPPPQQNRRLLATTSLDHATTPYWVTSDPMRRRLFQSGGSWSGPVQATVAQDGSGDFTTITAALKTVPKKNARRFVIRVKAGKYLERVFVDKYMTNVLLIGDGTDKTVVSGSKNFIDGTPTFDTATFVVEGRGFMAQGITFENTAGPQKHQAVAVRVKADQVVFYKCRITAFQDTLYVHSLRQFYRECDIEGTIDFIFGDAAAIFQRCLILPLQPSSNQKNTVTAQGRTDPNENTGIVIDDSGIQTQLGSGVTAKTYLGRPWKPYSTTVFMRSQMSTVIDPAGWMPWDGATEPPSTIFYGEYMNSGPGSATDRRVRWTGYRPALSDADAQRFTVGSFLQATDWLANTGVPST